jgi:iron complex transport system ATP-binding protein
MAPSTTTEAAGHEAGTAPLIEFRDVSVYRGDHLALDRLSLTIHAGEHVAILGPNGCGKSTLIKTLTRELYPTTLHGPYRLRLMGRDTWDVTSLRAMLGIVTNDLVDACVRGRSSDLDAATARRVTARDTVLSGFFSSIGIWRHHAVTPSMRRKADETLERLDLAHLADRPLDEVSSGEARRTVIGRALVHDPTALVLDEPTNSLDLGAVHDLRESIRALARSGTTLVMVTHHLPDIVPEIARVVLLDQGRLGADGPKAEVLASSRLSALFGVPVEVARRDGYYHAW